jgi:hypothetical protein
MNPYFNPFIMEWRLLSAVMVRGVGPPPYFTSKNMPVLCSTKVQNSPGLLQTLVMTTLKLSWLGTRAAYFWASNSFPGAILHSKPFSGLFNQNKLNFA